jgi:hypothetical protein
VPETVLDEIRRCQPEVAKDLERLRVLVKQKSRPDETPEDKLADDFSWLWGFTYQGEKLEAEEIEFVIQFLRDGLQHPGTTWARAGNSNKQPWALPRVLAALHEATKNAAQQWQISSHKIAREMASILNGNIADVCDIGPAGITVKDFSQLPRSITGAVQEIHETRNAQGTQIRIRMYDKNPIINVLSKIHGLQQPEKLDITIHGLEDRLTAALKRVPVEIEGELVVER